MTEETTVVRRMYYPGAGVVEFINIIIGLIEFVIGLRVLLELFAASTASGFVSWVYSISGSLIGPFANAFAPMGLGSGAVLDLSAILAIIGYAILGWVITWLLAVLFSSAV